MKTFLAYCRVSTDEQSINSSLNHQSESLRRLYDRSFFEGYNYVEERDSKSGGNQTERKLLDAVKNKLKEGDIIAVKYNDRFGRNTAEDLNLWNKIHDAKIRFFIDGREYTENDEYLFTNMQAFATQVRKTNKRNSLDGIKRLKESGRWVFKGTLLGYEIIKEGKVTRIKINANEAKIIRYLFDEYEKGRSLISITKEIESFGWRSRANKVLHAASLRRTLLHPIYCGFYNLKMEDEFKTHPQAIIGDNFTKIKSELYPPIISEKQWNKCLRSFRTIKRKNQSQFEYRYNAFPLTGLVRCKSCGSTYVHNFRKIRSGGFYEVYTAKHNKKETDCKTLCMNGTYFRF